MLKNIEFWKYRAFDYGCFDIMPLTILIGENNCGKTSLTQLIRMIIQNANFDLNRQNSALNLSGPYVEVLDPTDLVHNKEGNSFKVKFETDLSVSRDRITERPKSMISKVLNDLSMIMFSRSNDSKSFREFRNNIRMSDDLVIDEKEFNDIINSLRKIKENNPQRYAFEVIQNYFRYDNKGRLLDKSPHQMKDLDSRYNLLLDEMVQNFNLILKYERWLRKSASTFFSVEFSTEEVGENRIKLNIDELIINNSWETLFEYKNNSTETFIKVYFPDEEVVKIERVHPFIKENSNVFDILKSQLRIPWAILIYELYNSIVNNIAPNDCLHIGPYRPKVPHLFTPNDTDNNGDYLIKFIQNSLNDNNHEEQFNIIADNFDFNLSIKALLSSVFSLNISSKGSKEKFELSSVGFGVSQLIPIIGSLIKLKEKQIVIIEQPEAHLHPRFHAIVADLFVVLSKEFPTIRFIIETHSDHFLSRISKRIRDNTISNKEVKLYAIEPEFDKKNKFIQSNLNDLKISSEGVFKYPEGFIETKLEDEIGNPKLPTVR